tara:strand:+ start:1933 stop:2499 length:567 start_codon:yes stop_codon:yes gene_type:complete
MILNSKKVMDEMANITSKVIDINNDIRRVSVEVTKLQSQINLSKELKENQSQFLTEFKENAESIGTLKAEFEKELYNFKLMSSNVEKKLLEKFDEAIKNEIHEYFAKLRTDIQSFGDLKEKIDTISEDIKKATSELGKFVEISESIKKGDFELGNHAKKLQDMDNEKLELMRKIDNLERLLSKMRRSS